jgi:glycosyltransferase involved in cell wall biosynthesis
MKVVIATPLYPPDIGGPATYTKILEEGLPQKGIEVEVVKFGDVRHMPKLIRHYAYYRCIVKAARNADAVLALDPVSVGLPAAKAAQKAGKPFIVKIVGDYAWEQGTQRFGVTASLDDFPATEVSPPVRLLQKIQLKVANKATHIIVPSDYLKRMVSKWGVPMDKIVRIYNAVVLPELSDVPPEILALPRPLVLCVGRLVPWKHFDGVIDAIQLLHIKGVEVSLAIIGDGPLREKLERYAANTLGSSCRIVGMLPHAETLAAMQSADVFVLNSSYEGHPHTLIEALMLGVPVVATHVGGNGEVITDGKEGLLVLSGDTQGLADTIGRVISERDLHDRMAAEAKESAVRFSREAMVEEVAALLRCV